MTELRVAKLLIAGLGAWLTLATAEAVSFVSRPALTNGNYGVDVGTWSGKGLRERRLALNDFDSSLPRASSQQECASSFKGNISGIVESFVDSNQVVSGTFNAWFAATNSDFPILSQAALIDRCGLPTNWFEVTPWSGMVLGTNVWKGLTNALAQLVWTRNCLVELKYTDYSIKYQQYDSYDPSHKVYGYNYVGWTPCGHECEYSDEEETREEGCEPFWQHDADGPDGQFLCEPVSNGTPIIEGAYANISMRKFRYAPSLPYATNLAVRPKVDGYRTYTVPSDKTNFYAAAFSFPSVGTSPLYTNYVSNVTMVPLDYPFYDRLIGSSFYTELDNFPSPYCSGGFDSDLWACDPGSHYPGGTTADICSIPEEAEYPYFDYPWCYYYSYWIGLKPLNLFRWDVAGGFEFR